MTDEIIAFKGEAMLLNWSESKHGRTVVFLLDEETEVHPMKQFTTKRGKRAGTRFMCVLVEINDDETAVVQEKPKGGTLSISAARMCENEEFQKFAAQKLQSGMVSWTPYDRALNYIYEYCHLQSRVQLDHEPEAAKRFHELMKEFNQWRG